MLQDIEFVADFFCRNPYVKRHERMSSIKSCRNGVKHGAGVKRFPVPVVEYNEEEDDSTWDSKIPVQTFTRFLGMFNQREFEEALTLAGEMLKLEPDNKTLQAYLKVLDEHKDLAEEEEDDDDDDDDDDDEEEEDDDEEEEEDEADYAHNDNLRGGDENKKTHK